MAFFNAEGSIASLFQRCDETLEAFRTTLSTTPNDYANEAERCSDQIGRLHGWEREIDGRTGNLDYKLRRSRDLRQNLTELLSELSSIAVSSSLSPRSISPRLSLSSLDDESITSDTSSVLSLESTSLTPVECVLSEIEHIITCLLQLTPALKDAARTDDIARSFDARAAHQDIQHVKEKFSEVSENLAQRLGCANWKRRHYLISVSKSRPSEPTFPQDPSKQPVLFKEPRPSREPSQEGSSIDSVFQSLGGCANDADSSSGSDNEAESTAGPPTTHQTTLPSKEELLLSNIRPRAGSLKNSPRLRVPLPPAPNASLSGELFRCPYCRFELVHYDQGRKWIKHVMSDIEPYVCTLEDCKWPEKTYGSKRDWIHHEYKAHRTEIQWGCKSCNIVYSSVEHFVHHLHETHSLSDSPEDIRDVVQECEISISLAQRRRVCPLCKTRFETARQLQRHIADHLEQLALFVALSTGGQDESQQDLELRDDSDTESDIGAMSAIQSIPASVLSPDQAARLNVQKYFEVMSQFSADPLYEGPGDHEGENRKAPVEYPLFVVVHRANESFYGREESLAKTHRLLNEPGSIVVVRGLGGVGKTELAVQYAYRYRNHYDCVFWIQADTQPGLVESICQIAITLNLVTGTEDENQTVELSRDWLMQTDKRWLLIFDNLETWYHILHYIPRRFDRTTVGHVIVTTQHESMADQGSGDVHLAPFDDDEGARMLLHYMKKNEPYPEDILTIAREVSSFVGGLPVAISHVAGYLEKGEWDLEDLLEMFHDRRRVAGFATLEQDDLPGNRSHSKELEWSES